MLYKPAQWPVGLGLDIHRVRKRNYDMRFDLLEYETTIGHLSLYYDAGGMFDVEVNAGRYLAGDGARQPQFPESLVVGGRLAATLHHRRSLRHLWRGSFDKAIYVSSPLTGLFQI